MKEGTKTDIMRMTGEKDQEVLEEKTGLSSDALLMETRMCIK